MNIDLPIKKLSLIILLGILVLGFIIYSSFPNLTDTVLDQTGLSRIITIFIITNSLFSLVIPITIKRKALRNRKKDLVFSLFALWVSVFLILLEIIRGEPYYLLSFPDFANPFTRFAVIIWGVGVFYLLKTTIATLYVDTIKFQKKDIKFQHNNPKNWGIKLLNDKLSTADKDIYFPMIVLGDESSRPWKVLLRFVLSAFASKPQNNEKVKEKEIGSIYFTFTRLASEIKDKMLIPELNKMVDEGLIQSKTDVNWKNIIFIDCYTLKTERKLWNGNMKDSPIYYADSYNPHEINEKYEKALKKLFTSNCGHIRVVYDAISDFLKFTDFQIATQYLRHNMGFEQRKGIESLYLFRMGTMDKIEEEYFLWFSNGLLRMKQGTNSKNGEMLDVEFRGPFSTPQKFKMDYNYNEV